MLVLVFTVLFLIATGSLILFYGKTPVRKKKLLFAYSTFFLSLLFIELALHLFVMIMRPPAMIAHKGTYEYLIDNPIFKDQPDAENFLREWSDTKMIFKPFVVWDRQEFKGRYFNISKEGVRQTWAPKFAGDKPAVIYTFGGSTMWGAGVSDNQTIASYLSKILNATQPRYQVVNYGEVGYSFTQEVIQLLLLLRDGHRPDYVIFYDGINDIYAGYQAGRAELIMNTDMLSRKLDRTEPSAAQSLTAGLKKVVNEHFLIYKSFRLLVGKFQKPFTETGARLTPEQIERLAHSIRDSYAKTYAILETIAATYNFEFICFWQPSGHLEKKLFAAEYNSHPRFKDAALKALSCKTTEIVLQNAPPRLFDLTDALKDRQTLFYFDSMHLCAEGNYTIAAQMAGMVRNELLD